MTITQENLIKKIANKEDIDVATVRDIFKSAEDIIFDYLSSTTPSENIIIKIYYVITGKFFSPYQSNKNKDRKISFKILSNTASI